MIFSATFSNPSKEVPEIFGRDYVRAKVRKISAKTAKNYFAEFYTKTQVFHKHFSESEMNDFVEKYAGTVFKSCFIRTESVEINIQSSKGKVIKTERKLDKNSENILKNMENIGQNRKKNHILPEGTPVPFLVRLGVMTKDGKVVSSKQNKFRQINRFLEIFSDILDDVFWQKKESGDDSPLCIVDFGSGKSYLTFAVEHFLKTKQIDCEIFGLDLKEDVIEFCSNLAKELNLSDIKFAVGDISHYDSNKNHDIIITLHACDTATDFALDYAVRKNAKAILSVPCCQHELNAELSAADFPKTCAFEPLLRYGLIKERFAALATDALRAETLENAGYKVQVLEFIGEENTPKNLLIRATKKSSGNEHENGAESLLNALKIKQTFVELSKI